MAAVSWRAFKGGRRSLQDGALDQQRRRIHDDQAGRDAGGHRRREPCPGPERRAMSAPTSMMTCRMAPPPTPKQTAIHKGLTACVPRIVPTMAGKAGQGREPDKVR